MVNSDPLDVQFEKATNVFIQRCLTELKALETLFADCDRLAAGVEERVKGIRSRADDLAARLVLEPKASRNPQAA